VPSTQRKLAFVLAATDQGTFIVNRYDFNTNDHGSYGVGGALLHEACYDPDTAAMGMRLLDWRRETRGDGVIAIDCGANIGVFTVSWARHMTGWGAALGIEAQERVFYALAGNIALANCANAQAMFAAAGAEPGEIRIPALDYAAQSSFGSLSLRPGPHAEDIGQPLAYDGAATAPVRVVTIDQMAPPRLDLLKIDVEGMELEVLRGARRTIERFRPAMIVEAIKVDRDALAAFLDEIGYVFFAIDMDVLAVHADDPIRDRIRTRVAPPPEAPIPEAPIAGAADDGAGGGAAKA
jgi:FkbM family methyltransferase